MRTVLLDKVSQSCDQSKWKSETKLYYTGSLVIYPKIQILFYTSKSSTCFTIKSLNEAVLCTYTLVRGLILTDTLGVETTANVVSANMVSVRLKTDYFSVYFSRVMHTSNWKKSASLLSWSVASLPTWVRRPSPACGVAALICINGRRKNKQTCCRRRRKHRMCVPDIVQKNAQVFSNCYITIYKAEPKSGIRMDRRYHHL